MVNGMGRQAYPDFDQVVLTAKFMPDVVIKEACKSDIPHEVVYEIAQNKPLAEKLMKMNSLGIAEEISKIASVLGNPSESTTEPKPKPKKISNAPDPIKPSTGTTSVQEKSLAELGHAAFRKKRGYAR